jgi:hypothetical protein
MNKCEICGIKPHNKLRKGKWDKCYIKYGYNKDSWDNYNDFKNWQYYYDRKKINCETCGKEMIRTSIYRHRKLHIWLNSIFLQMLVKAMFNNHKNS